MENTKAPRYPCWWAYKIHEDGTIKYLFHTQEFDPGQLLVDLQPFFERGKSYEWSSFLSRVLEAGTGLQAFGVQFVYDSKGDAGHCYRCMVPGKMMRTALVCPLCNELIGGF